MDSRPSNAGARLRAARTNLGLTQHELAERAGLSKEMVASQERELRSLSLKAVETYARVLAVSPAWLAYGSGEPVPGMPGVYIDGGRLLVDITVSPESAMQIAAVIKAMQAQDERK